MTESSSASPKSNKKTKAAALAGVLSMVLWIIGFVLLFVLPGTPHIWLSDAFLLVGFFPLLYVWKAGWPWVVFGVLNLFIAFTLELTKQITPDMVKGVSPDVMASFLVGQKHMAEMHPFKPWFFAGVFSILVGVVRMTTTVIRYIRKKYQEKS